MKQQDLFRHIINGCDEALKDVFLRRMDASVNMAKYKMENGLTIYDEVREAEVLNNVSTGLSPELSLKSKLLWKTLLRMSRGRQYRYFIQHDETLQLAHEADIRQQMPDGVVLCPDNISRVVSATLGKEVRTCPSIAVSIDGLLDGTTDYAAVVINDLYDTDWLYNIIFDKPIYINSFTNTSDGRMVALMSRQLYDLPENSIVTMAFAVSTKEQGSLAQALSVLVDCHANVEYLRLKTQNIDRDEQQQVNIVFLEVTGKLLSTDIRSALFQLQSELPFFRVLGYRVSM